MKGLACIDTLRAEFGRIVEGRGLTVAVAESVTGGSLARALADVPGSGVWFRGGVVAYNAEVKFELLGVEVGPVVTASAARAMARGAAHVLRADVAIATTGCSGPEPMDDQPVGTLWTGFAIGDDANASHHQLEQVDGPPEAIVDAFVRIALSEATRFLKGRLYA